MMMIMAENDCHWHDLLSGIKRHESEEAQGAQDAQDAQEAPIALLVYQS